MSRYETALQPAGGLEDVPSDASVSAQSRSTGSEERDTIPNSGRSKTLDQVKAAVSGKLNEFASKLESRGQDPATRNPELAGYEAQAADWIKRSANYIDEMNPQQIKDDIAAQVRRNPGKTLLIATAAGLVLGSIFRRR